MYKLDKQYNIDKILEEFNTIVCDIGWDPSAPKYWNSITLQSPNGDIFHQDCRADNFYVDVNNDKSVDFNRDNESYKTLNIPADWELSKFIVENNLTRTKLISIMPTFCYKVHTDWTNRIQMALVTDPNCYYIEEGISYHIPVDGYGYVTETTKPHTAINASHKDRIHVIGCVDNVA